MIMSPTTTDIPFHGTGHLAYSQVLKSNTNHHTVMRILTLFHNELNIFNTNTYQTSKIPIENRKTNITSGIGNGVQYARGLIWPPGAWLNG